MGKSGNKPLPNEQIRDYKFSIKLYPDCEDYDCFRVIRKLETYFEQWAWIVHDNDTRSFSVKTLRKLSNGERGRGVLQKVRRRYRAFLKPHVHFYGKNNCHCRITPAQIVQYLEIPYKYCTRPNEFSPATDWLACLYYTIHRNAPNKFQYDVKEVHTNIPNFERKITDVRPLQDDLKILYQLLDEYEQRGEELPLYELPRLLMLRGCTIQLSRWGMVKDISKSYQYHKLGRVVE